MFLRRFVIAILDFLVLVCVIVLAYFWYFSVRSSLYLAQLGPEAPILTTADQSYRDLNKNGKLDPYEDSEESLDVRVQDVLARMTLEEKAGMVFISMITMNPDGSLQRKPTPANPFTLMISTGPAMIVGRNMTHFNLLQGSDAASMAAWHNRVQKLAERTRLGIPLTIASDPRHTLPVTDAAAFLSGGFSEWPDPAGLAATRDTLMAEHFGDIVRQEYLAVGIRLALHPMVDLATEPRWARIHGTFGEDAELAAQMTRAYIRGLQGPQVTDTSVAAMVKHFPGAGPQEDGWDPHFVYGKDQVYPGGMFEYHLKPFAEGALAANAAQVMVSYGVGKAIGGDGRGFAFRHDIVTGQLREALGFDGVISTDWSVLSGKKVAGVVEILESPGWGVEELDPIDRAEMALNAGIDIFGGESNSRWVVRLVESQRVSEHRLDQSVARLLRDKFRLGLFDDPYVNVEAAAQIVGSAPFVDAGREAQRASLVLLKNVEIGSEPFLPLGTEPVRLYVQNVDKELARRYATVVDSVANANVALVRLRAPHDAPRGDSMLEGFFHQGDLDFKAGELVKLLALMLELPTVVDIYLDRPAVINDIAERAAGLVANFGASDEVVLDAVFGQSGPAGRLPFELPSSMEAVREQLEDVPYDSSDPLYPFGFGLRYGGSEPNEPVFPDSLLQMLNGQALSDSLLQVIGEEGLTDSVLAPNQ